MDGGKCTLCVNYLKSSGSNIFTCVKAEECVRPEIYFEEGIYHRVCTETAQTRPETSSAKFINNKITYTATLAEGKVTVLPE